MSNIIDDVLEWNPTLALSGMMEKQPDVAKTTEPNKKISEESQTSSEKTAPADTSAETILEQHENEETGNTQGYDQQQQQHHDSI